MKKNLWVFWVSTIIFASTSVYGTQCGSQRFHMFKLLKGFSDKQYTLFQILKSQGTISVPKPSRLENLTDSQVQGLFESYQVKSRSAEALVTTIRDSSSYNDDLFLGSEMAPFANAYKNLRELADAIVPGELRIRPTRFLVVLKPAGTKMETSFGVSDSAIMMRVQLYGEIKNGIQFVYPHDVKEAQGWFEGRLKPRVVPRGVFGAEENGRFYVEEDAIHSSLGGLDVVIGLGAGAKKSLGIEVLPGFTRQSPDAEEIRTIEAFLFLN